MLQSRNNCNNFATIAKMSNLVTRFDITENQVNHLSSTTPYSPYTCAKRAGKAGKGEATMKSYKLTFNGKQADVEMMIKIIDKLFRRWYNVYGGKRVASWRDHEGYHVVMVYTANWNNWWMPFTEIYLAGYRKVNRIHWIDDESYYKLG